MLIYKTRKESPTMNAVIYARYSSHNQTEQSIEGQLRINHEFAKREGYTIVGEYIDRAISGTSADGRPEFQRMIEASKKRQFDVVIVYKLDRFARNRYDSVVYKHKLKQNNVRVISATESISDNPEGMILEAVLEASAEYFSKELSQKVKRGMLESAIKGNSTGGQMPLGYTVEEKKMVIQEEEARIVRFVFEQYAEGVGKKEIADMLNDKGLRTRRGKEFSVHNFQDMMRNKKYIGLSSFAGVEYTDTYPPILSEDLFFKVQKRLDRMARAPGTKKAKEEYLLFGKAFCGMCGSPMVGESGRSRNGTTHHYYNCAKRKKHHTCKKKNEKKDFLEWYVVEQTLEYVLTPWRMEEIAEGVVAQYEKEFNSGELKSMEKRLNQIGNEADRIFQLIFKTDNEKLVKRYEEQVIALDAQKADLEIDVAKLKIATQIRYSKDDIMVWLQSFCTGEILERDFQKKIIDLFINAVYVYDEKVVIYYNIRGGKQVSFIDNSEALSPENTGDLLNEPKGEMVRLCEEMVYQTQQP